MLPKCPDIFHLNILFHLLHERVVINLHQHRRFPADVLGIYIHIRTVKLIFHQGFKHIHCLRYFFIIVNFA